MWKSIVEPDRPQMKNMAMRFACCIRKATNPHSQYVLFIAVPQRQWLDERAPMLRYTYIACLVIVVPLRYLIDIGVCDSTDFKTLIYNCLFICGTLVN
jgi:hypothetical protein